MKRLFFTKNFRDLELLRRDPKRQIYSVNDLVTRMSALIEFYPEIKLIDVLCPAFYGGVRYNIAFVFGDNKGSFLYLYVPSGSNKYSVFEENNISPRLAELAIQLYVSLYSV